MCAEPFAFASAQAAAEAAVLVAGMDREDCLPPLEAAMLGGEPACLDGAALRTAAAIGALAAIRCEAMDPEAADEVAHALALLRSALAGLPPLPAQVAAYYGT